MELRHLRYYVAVAEELHFGRAAERLHIAQPPLSQQIKNLESELGVTLLLRSTRRVELTPSGERFLDRARAILAAAEDAGEEARRVSAGYLGRLSVGFTGSASYELLPRIARALSEQLPGVDLDLHGELLTPRQVDGLLAHDLDVAFLRPPVGEQAITVEPLRQEPLVLALPEAHPCARGTGQDEPVELAALADEHFIGYPSQHRSVMSEAALRTCRQAGFEPRLRMECAETSTLVSFVAAGIGLALVPESVQHLRITGATYRPLTDDAAGVGLAVAYRSEDESPHLQRALTVVRSLFP